MIIIEKLQATDVQKFIILRPILFTVFVVDEAMIEELFV